MNKLNNLSILRNIKETEHRLDWARYSFNCGKPFQFYAFQPTLIFKSLNVISIDIYCPPEYYFLFTLIINVFCSNPSTLRTFVCLSDFTALHVVIPIEKKKEQCKLWQNKILTELSSYIWTRSHRNNPPQKYVNCMQLVFRFT